MCLTFKKNNKQTKKPVNRFLQDDTSAGIRSLQTSIEIKLPKPMEWTIVHDWKKIRTSKSLLAGKFVLIIVLAGKEQKSFQGTF